MTLPFPASPASIKTDLPSGEMIRIESPLTGPTSSTWTCSSLPDAGGGLVFHHGKTNFQPTYPAAAKTTTRTAATQPQPLVDLLIQPCLCLKRTGGRIGEI